MNKVSATLIGIIALLLPAIYISLPKDNPDMYIIGINQISDHPALHETVKGIKDKISLNQTTLEKPVNILQESANSNLALANQISKNFNDKRVNVLVAVGTISAQASKSATRISAIPVVFSSVTSPEQSGLLNNLQSPELNITGVSNMMDHSKQLENFKLIFPEMVRIGVIYNPGEANSNTNLQLIKKAASNLNIDIIEGAVNKTNDSPITTEYLIKKRGVDVILIDGDNTALSSLPSIIKIAKKLYIPVLSTDNDTIKLGVSATVGCNQYELGLQTGQMIIDLLNGKEIKDIPVAYPNHLQTHINEKSLKDIGIKVPDSTVKNLNIIRH